MCGGILLRYYFLNKFIANPGAERILKKSEKNSAFGKVTD